MAAEEFWKLTSTLFHNGKHEQTNEMHMKSISREMHTCRGKFRADQQELNFYSVKVASLTVEWTFFILNVKI